MIEISQTFARIGIETTPSKLEIQAERAKLDIQQKHAKVNIHTELPKVLIDQYECRATSGLKNDSDLIKEYAQRGMQAALEFIGKTAGDGEAFAAIEKGSNPIPAFAVRDAYPVHEFGIDYMPKARPKITVTGEVNIEAERNSEGVNSGVKGTYTPGKLNFSFHPSVVQIYLTQKASISLNYQGTNVDSRV